MVLDTSLHKVCPDYPLGRLYYTFMGIIRTEFLCLELEYKKNTFLGGEKAIYSLKSKGTTGANFSGFAIYIEAIIYLL